MPERYTNALVMPWVRICLDQRVRPITSSIHSNLFVKHEGTSSFINPQRGDRRGSTSQLTTHFLWHYGLSSSLLLSRVLVPLRSWPRLNVYILTARIIPAFLLDSRPLFCRPCNWRQVTRNKSTFNEWVTIDLPSDMTGINPRLLFQVRGSGYVRTGWNLRSTGRVFGCEKSLCTPYWLLSPVYWCGERGRVKIHDHRLQSTFYHSETVVDVPVHEPNRRKGRKGGKRRISPPWLRRC